jgi:hypothetical protein
MYEKMVEPTIISKYTVLTLDYIMFEIDYLFNESEKVKVAYKCDQREYMCLFGKPTKWAYKLVWQKNSVW